MKIDLAGRTAELSGSRNALAAAVEAALAANGAQWTKGNAAITPDILILSHPLDVDTAGSAALTERAAATAKAMLARGSGRIVHLLSAMGVVPMRRHAGASAAMASAIAALRVLAMQSAPKVQVNGVAAGFIEGPDGAADPAMLSHIPLARAGTAEEVANAVLFLCDPMNSYTTGQVLAVDGGWTTGYGRDF